MTFLKWITLTFTLLSTGCANYHLFDDIEIEANADPNAQFERYSSYGWMGSVGVLRNKPNEFKMLEYEVGKDLRIEIENQLRIKGYENSIIKPELGLYYAIGIEQTSKPASDEPYPEGRLMLLMVDLETKTTVWVGVTRAEVDVNRESSEVLSRIEYTIEKMFESFPARK